MQLSYYKEISVQCLVNALRPLSTAVSVVCPSTLTMHLNANPLAAVLVHEGGVGQMRRRLLRA